MEKLAAGGDGLGHLHDGRVVFVKGALPAESVAVEITDDRRDFARARLVDIVEPSPWRADPPCPYVRTGCGGCGWQHIEPARQLDLKVQIVRDALRRTGHLPDAVVTPGAAVTAQHYRTTARLAVDSAGRAGMRHSQSHTVVPLDTCLVCHPGISELFPGLRADTACEVSLRIGVASGERTAMVHPSPRDPGVANRSRGAGRQQDGRGQGGPGRDGRRRDGRRAGAVASATLHGLPPDVALGPDATVHETVAGVSLRVSAASFFQSGVQAAELLVAAVREAAGELPAGARLLDAYGGVGLFAATMGAAHTTVVEASGSATRDAADNLRDADTEIHHGPFERWTPVAVDVAVADPARTGLGAAGVERLAGTAAERIVLVSCDPVAMARDVGALTRLGYDHYGACVLDLFPFTSHVEVVTQLRRRPTAVRTRVRAGDPHG